MVWCGVVWCHFIKSINVHDHLLIAESVEEHAEKFKKGMETKGLQINMKKTKIMVSDCDTGSVRISGRWLCPVCKKGVGSNFRGTLGA